MYSLPVGTDRAPVRNNLPMNDMERIEARIAELTNWRTIPKPRIITDTSDPMRIQRGDVMRLGGHDYLVEGNKYETRFGIADQPKYWVFGAIELDSGEKKVIKTVFNEDFHVHIGVFKIHCFRSPEKEAKVLEMTRHDKRFMQGVTTHDDKRNNVRILDFIPGKTIFQYVYDINKSHEQYYHEDLPDILHKLVHAMEGIQLLHDYGTCHGDVRNDHIIIDANSGDYRWIDFDLNQHVSDFDVWSLGNILNYAIGKGINSFQQTMRSKDFSDEVKNSLRKEDGSAFYEYRIMNLRKLYPYIPERLNNILLHFTIRPHGVYTAVSEMLSDYRMAIEDIFS